ncbi:hypothetical protein RBSH_02419 [Rhodopirellula baltica SH28]|uniref:Uncharacterized protein n=2 Tax=Rhodopirellula baltica TaxID=265606 RepID=K5CEL8_RHOBT|nr:hypothetical protein RBSH_02419 [Rhodopirellula baltica SH28]ELP34966.1 hypothetical protein RBSWK_00966 [Rhodopirellula baltica SWK14]
MGVGNQTVIYGIQSKRFGKVFLRMLIDVDTENTWFEQSIR